MLIILMVKQSTNGFIIIISLLLFKCLLKGIDQYFDYESGSFLQLCFLRQFKSSIKKSDYLALRLGFITVGIKLITLFCCVLSFGQLFPGCKKWKLSFLTMCVLVQKLTSALSTRTHASWKNILFLHALNYNITASFHTPQSRLLSTFVFTFICNIQMAMDKTKVRN